MRTTDCQNCGKTSIPLNDTMTVDGKVYCNECFEKTFPDESALQDKEVEKPIDPSICVNCGTDYGDEELEPLAGQPVCENCRTTLREKSFPNWVKGFFIGVLLLVVFSIAWNYRFYTAYDSLKKFEKAQSEGRYANAAIYMSLASANLPERPELKAIADFYKGVNLMINEKSTEALLAFEASRGKLPKEYDMGFLDAVIQQARIGSAFEKGNYELFLLETRKNLEAKHEDAFAWGGVASAYACLYATTGVDSFRRLAEEYLASGQDWDDHTEGYHTYVNCIQHRLYTKEIMSCRVFEQMYPGGWAKPGEKK